MKDQRLLIDASRLIWRVWSGRLPTGIDKVCLAYLDHFGSQSQAVIQRGDWRVVLSYQDSQALFALLGQGGAGFRRRLIAKAPAALLRARAPQRGQKFLNIGHTGLNAQGLTQWTARTGIRPIYLIHDLIPITHPQFCRVSEADRHRQRMTNALASAAGIIANSQATLDDLRQFAEAERIPMPASLVSLLAGHDFGQKVEPATLGKPYFIAVGTIEGRKNYLLLLHLWRRLIAKMGGNAPLLVIVGQRGWTARDVFDLLDNAHDLRGHVREMGRCSDEELGNLIAGARALLMPSHAEGFGLPVVEALQLGTPVIANDLPVYREIASDIPTYVAVGDEGAWENAVTAFLGESAERNRQLAAIPYYTAPSWPAHFTKVEQWLADVS